MESTRIISSPGNHNLQHTLRSSIDRVQKRLWISSPFITGDGLSLITQRVKDRVDYRLITRLNEEDIANKLLDPHAFADFIERGGQARFHDKSLHAKVWIMDNLVYIGSANLTGSGLSRNIEVMTEITFSGLSKNDYEKWFTVLWNRLKASIKSPEELRDIANSVTVNPLFSNQKNNVKKKKSRDFGGTTSQNQMPDPEINDVRGIFNISGENEHRINMNHNFKDSLKYEGAATTSTNKGHPKWKAGEKVILSYLATRDNGRHDHCIYGRATVDIAHRPGIDEIPPWLEAGKMISKKNLDQIYKWAYIIWVRDVQIFSQARNALWLSEINANRSAPLISPRSLMQKSYIYLSIEQLDVLDSLLDKKFSTEQVEYLSQGSQVWWNAQISPGHLITKDRLEIEASV